MDLFVSGDRMQNISWPKITKNNISSVIPFSFNVVELCVVTINEKP